jgi:hypothetical protein
MAKWKILRDSIRVGAIGHDRRAQHPPPLRVFGRQQVAFARMRAQDFAPSRYLEALGYGLAGLNAFWTTHSVYS